MSQVNDAVARAAVKPGDMRNEEADRKRTELLERLDRLRGNANANDLVRIEKIAAIVNDPDQMRDSIRFDFMALEANMNRRLASSREAAELRMHLDGLQGPEVSTLISELRDVEAGERELDALLRSKVKGELETQRREEDRKYVAEVLADGFRKLGYVVGSDFATAFESGASLDIRKNDGQPYAAQLKFDAARIEIDSELVVTEERMHLTAEEIGKRDHAAEAGW
jgi:hypothetical protein